MAGIRYPPEDPDLVHPARAPPPAAPPAAADLISDDDRSVAADSWSIKSEYGSTLDDEQRHVDAAEVLSSCTLRAFSDYSSDKDEPDANEVEPSMLGLQSYWDSAYAEDLANFQEHGHAGEVWFGVEVMGIVTDWTKNLCTSMAGGHNVANDIGIKHDSGDDGPKDLSSWSVLDIGTGNGLLLQELAKQGFSDLTGTDYSEGAIDLARSLAARDEFSYINFVVDDVLDSKLERQFHLVMDKGTLDAIGLHPEGPMKRFMYWESMSKLVAPGGLLVSTPVKYFLFPALFPEEIPCYSGRWATSPPLVEMRFSRPTIHGLANANLITNRHIPTTAKLGLHIVNQILRDFENDIFLLVLCCLCTD